MALVLKDRVQETTTTTGQGTITLAGAVSGFQTFAAIGNGNTTYYTIAGGSQWEMGIGTYTASGTTLSRDTVISNSLGDTTKIDFAAGTKNVFCTYPAEQSLYVDGSSITPGTAATLPIVSGGTGSATATFSGANITSLNASAINAGTIGNAYTTAASANGASTIVARDATGNFAGNAITGASFSGSGASLTSLNASSISSGTLANARTTASSSNGASTIVARGASGEFAAGVITADGSGLTALNASNVSTGTLAVARGGTGAATLTANNVILGNTTSAVQFVAPGTNGNVLTSNGTTWTSAAPGGGFAAGTVMLFAQTAAPTGWTKNTSTGDNSALRVVTGTASTGGSVAFTTAFASQTPTITITGITGSAAATTLTTSQIPSHTHTVKNNGCAAGAGLYPFQGGGTVDTGSTGGGGSHTHSFTFSSGTATSSAINLAVQYIDVIRATKD